MDSSIGIRYEVTRPGGESTYLAPELSLLYVLKGRVGADLDGRKSELHRGDMLLINPGILCELSFLDNPMIGICSWSVGFLTKLLKGKHVFLYCNTAESYSKRHRELREAMDHMTATYAMDDRGSDSFLLSQSLRVLDILLEYYQVEQTASGKEDKEDARTREIMLYIMQNLHGDINLTELADRMYVSASTLSRLFKKITGLYFADYVMQLRVKEAMTYLTYSDESLTQIALSSGFSGSSSFNRAFRKVTGMTPSQYRDANRAGTGEEEKTSRDIRDELLASGQLTEEGSRSLLISVDLARVDAKKLNRCWNSIINLGEFADLTRAGMQDHALYLKEQLHFQYIRLWNVFSERLLFTDGRTRGKYNYSVIDPILDFLVLHGLRPFLDFGRRASSAIRSDGEIVFYEDHYIRFGSRELFEEACADFFRHIRRKYGRDEVSQWIFELSADSMNEESESALYEGKDYDFYTAWRYLYRALKKEIPDARIGGVSAAAYTDVDFLTDFYGKCSRYGCRPDFCSFRLFPHSDSYRRENGAVKEVLQGVRSEETQISQMRRIMEFCGMEDTPLYISEWNNTIVNRSFLNDSAFRAAYLASRAPILIGAAEQAAVMSGSDWVSYYYDASGLVFGGVGLIAKDTIRKPAYYAVSFLNLLGEELLCADSHAIVTRARDGSFYVLANHFIPLPEVMRGNREAMSEVAGAEEEFSDEAPLVQILRLSGLEHIGSYRIKRRSVGVNRGNILGEWKRLDYAEELSAEDIRYLRDRCIPEISIQTAVIGEERELRLDVQLSPQEIVLLHIYQDG